MECRTVKVLGPGAEISGAVQTRVTAAKWRASKPATTIAGRPLGSYKENLRNLHPTRSPERVLRTSRAMWKSVLHVEEALAENEKLEQQDCLKKNVLGECPRECLTEVLLGQSIHLRTLQ